MKKFSKIGKRVLAFFLVALMNINSYAAVGANDGSAFVTKAEFDALVNTFNEQMDNYEGNIVSKIDGAIANYLAGMSGKSTTTKQLFFTSWENVTSFNGDYKPTYSIPIMRAVFSVAFQNSYSWNSGNYWKNATVVGVGSVTSSSNRENIRPLVKTKESEGSASYTMYWNGVAVNYEETYVVGGSCYADGNYNLYGIEDGSTTKKMTLYNPTEINLSDGYNPNVSSSTSVNNFKVYWTSSGGSALVNFTNKKYAVAASVVLKKDSKGKDKKYEHIINYSGDTSWTVSNEIFTKTFMTRNESSIKSVNVLSDSSTAKTSNGGVAGAYYYPTKGTFRTALNFEFTDDAYRTIPSVGMIGDIKAKNIYQFSTPITYTHKGKGERTIKELGLEKGLPLFYAEEGVNITWNPYFEVGKAKNASGEWVDSTATRVKLFLSVGEFKDDITSSDELIEARSTSGVATDKSVLCKIDSNEKVEFTMPKTGVVYAKWVPDISTYKTDTWLSTLDVTKCSKYVEVIDE